MSNYTPVLIIVILIATLNFARQIYSMYRPIKGNGFRILASLFYLLPGAALFMNPNAVLTPIEVVIAMVIGCMISIPLILATMYERRSDGNIYVKKSLVFVILFITFFGLRWVLRGMIDMDSDSRMLLFFISACSYLIPWKVVSFLKFLKVKPLIQVALTDKLTDEK